MKNTSEIKLAWIIKNKVLSYYAIGDEGRFFCDCDDSKMVELALHHNNIPYESSLMGDEYKNVLISFCVSDFRKILPDIYDELFEMGKTNYRELEHVHSKNIEMIVESFETLHKNDGNHIEILGIEIIKYLASQLGLNPLDEIFKNNFNYYYSHASKIIVGKYELDFTTTE